MPDSRTSLLIVVTKTTTKITENSREKGIHSYLSIDTISDNPVLRFVPHVISTVKFGETPTQETNKEIQNQYKFTRGGNKETMLFTQ